MNPIRPTHRIRRNRQGTRLLLLTGVVALSGWVLSGCALDTSQWPKKKR